MSRNGGGGGGEYSFIHAMYVRPQKVWLLSRFGLKQGVDFDNFGLK